MRPPPFSNGRTTDSTYSPSRPSTARTRSGRAAQAWYRPRDLEVAPPTEQRPYAVVYNPRRGSYVRLSPAAYRQFLTLPTASSGRSTAPPETELDEQFIADLDAAGLITPSDDREPEV